MQFSKKILIIINKSILIIGLSIPFLLFLNRFLVPDNSFDSINYHTFLGFRGWNPVNTEFYPTGIHNFSPILDMINYPLIVLLGYRLGSIGSLIFLYLSFFYIYKIYRVYFPKYDLISNIWLVLLLINSIYSFEIFLQISTYFTDIVVTFLIIFSICYLLLFRRTSLFNYLLLSSISMSFLSVGKISTWYIFVPYFSYLILALSKLPKITPLKKISYFIMSIVISISLLFPWMLKNYKLTGNPVYPFYNAIFKSELYPEQNFSQSLFGGRNLFEKVTWGIVSIKYPQRLGEIHDLFTDYKINIYFISALLIGLFYYLNKKNRIREYVVLYLLIYISWSISFGYLRYGIALEMLGALLLLLFFSTYQDKKLKLLLIGIVVLLFFDNFQILHRSLAYDLSFRKNYFYNHQEYLNEFRNINTNNISIDKKLLMDHNPQIYLNCTTPSTAYYVLSNVNELPLLNIDSKTYGGMVSNFNYKQETYSLAFANIDKYPIHFVTIVGREGLTNNFDNCIESIELSGFKITEISQIDTFLGYGGQKLSVIFGDIPALFKNPN